MITVQEFANAVQHKITGGSTYGWDCFGPDVRWLDAEEPNVYSASIVFGGPEFLVHIAEVHDHVNDRSYRLIHPEFKDAYYAEAEQRKTDPDLAWDDHKFIDLESDTDFLEKCAAIVAGEPYDTRVSIPLDIPDADLLKFMIAAHERNMTFNDFVEEALQAALEDFRQDPDGTTARLKAHLNK